MVAPVVDVDQLDAPDAWPPDAALYDTSIAAFLDRERAAELARGITKDHRHALIYRPLVEVVPGVLFEGYNILSAPPKIGKTIIAHQLMIAVDMGRDWLGRPCRQGPVLFFGLEDTLASITTRDHRLLGEGLADYIAGGAGQLAITDAGRSPVERLARLAELLDAGYGPDRIPYALVVIDTSPRFLGNGAANMNAYERGLDLYAPLDELGLRHHVAILGIHHDRKSQDGDDFDAVSGGLSITGTAQSVLALRRTRGGHSGTLNVYPRAAEERRYALEFERGQWALTPALAAELAAEAQGCRRDILGWLWDRPDGGTLRELVQTLREHSYANIQQALNRLRRDDKIRHDEGRWLAVRTEPDVAPVESVRPPITPAAVDSDGPCDQCGERPARVDRSGSRRCAACSPHLFPAASPQPPTPTRPPDTPTAYARPSWAPDPLDHPIRTFDALIEESFRIKKVQLIRHPYPAADDVPEPFRNRGRGRGMLVHEGSHHWHNPDLIEGVMVSVIDRNGGFLGSLGSAEVPIGRLHEHPGRGPAREVGAHQLDRWPAWTVPHLPHPGGHTPKGADSIWITTPTLKLLSERAATGELGAFTVVRSWTGPGMRLEQLQTALREARAAAIAADDREFVEFIKAVYSLGISTAGESSHNTHLWRPDWNSVVRAQFHANMFRAAVRARHHGLTVAAVKNTDELHLIGDPFAQCFSEGRALNEWKAKDQPYPWVVKNARR